MPTETQCLTQLHQALAQFTCDTLRPDITPSQLMDLMHSIEHGRRCLRFNVEMTGAGLVITAHAYEFESGHAAELIRLAGPVATATAAGEPASEATADQQDPRHALSESLIAAVLGLAAHSLAREPKDVREPIANELSDGRAAVSATVNMDCQEATITGHLFRSDGRAARQFKLFEFVVTSPALPAVH